MHFLVLCNDKQQYESYNFYHSSHITQGTNSTLTSVKSSCRALPRKLSGGKKQLWHHTISSGSWTPVRHTRLFVPHIRALTHSHLVLVLHPLSLCSFFAHSSLLYVLLPLSVNHHWFTVSLKYSSHSLFWGIYTVAHGDCWSWSRHISCECQQFSFYWVLLPP